MDVSSRTKLRQRLHYAVQGLAEHRPPATPPVHHSWLSSSHRTYVLIDERLLIEARFAEYGATVFAIDGDEPTVTFDGSIAATVEGGEFVVLEDYDAGPWWDLLERLCGEWETAVQVQIALEDEQQRLDASEYEAARRAKLDRVAEALS